MGTSQGHEPIPTCRNGSPSPVLKGMKDLVPYKCFTGQHPCRQDSLAAPAQSSGLGSPAVASVPPWDSLQWWISRADRRVPVDLW